MSTQNRCSARMGVWLVSFFLPGFVMRAQSSAATQQPPELSLILEPGPLVDGLPQSFTFHLQNTSQEMLRIPEPDFDCGNASINGSIVLDEGWQPPVGIGMGRGRGSCDFGGYSTGAKPPSLTTVASAWRTVKPGESYYIQVTCAQMHCSFKAAGEHTFSGTYLPPSVSDEQVQALKDAGIVVPRHKSVSGSLTYRTVE